MATGKNSEVCPNVLVSLTTAFPNCSSLLVGVDRVRVAILASASCPSPLPPASARLAAASMAWAASDSAFLTYFPLAAASESSRFVVVRRATPLGTWPPPAGLAPAAEIYLGLGRAVEIHDKDGALGRQVRHGRRHSNRNAQGQEPAA